MRGVCVVLAVLAQMCPSAAEAKCGRTNLDFIVQKGNAVLAAMEDDVRADLKKVGIEVTTRFLEKDEFNKAMIGGNFHLCFSETWGPPYDPHGYAASWKAPDEAHFAAMKGMTAPMTKDKLTTEITNVMLETNIQAREQKWKTILSAVHEQAIDLPLSGKRIPTVLSKRLGGYSAGQQQYDYPVHSLEVLSGSKTITVAPGSQTGLFDKVGPLDPHTYRPNEFWASNWVYEGLIHYGADGVLEPALAVSWTVATNGKDYTFKLRQGVKFHDGSDWNCTVAKLNFDHVFSPALTTGDNHGWYDLPKEIVSWSCPSTYEFKLTTKNKYYPLLQELSYIRPLRFLSPVMFANGLTTDPTTNNTCRASKPQTGNGVTVTCTGTKGVSGTGPFKYIETATNGDAKFERNTAHWRSTPKVETIVVKKYATAADVMTALTSGSLDAVMGAGVLAPADLKKIQTQHAANFDVFVGPPIMNRIIIINAAKAPTNDLKLRKTIIHAVNKAAIIDKELYGFAEPVDALFPKNAPYCGLDLTPRWDYDIEKAKLLNCPESPDIITDSPLVAANCGKFEVDFLVQKGNAVLAAIEDDVRADLAKVGITAKTRFVEKDEFNKDMTSGNFNLCFSETWGPPYDPHGYAASWKAPDEAHFAAMKGMKAPMTKDQLTSEITSVMLETNIQTREAKWTKILSAVHEQAIDLPISGKRIPTVLRKRLGGYTAGQQQYDYPVHTLEVLSGSKTITVSPGSQTGLFDKVGPLDPHTYRPNEFWASNWVYEGLIHYGANGVLEASLATSWAVASNGKDYTFTLRQGVKFHDGSDWNCSVAKLNFDHVLSPALTTGDNHGWYDLPKEIVSWSCPSTYEFKLTTKNKYYPLLQELSYIRPLRMLSPVMFANGLTTDPTTNNTCRASKPQTGNGVTVTCTGTKGVSGTGPFKYIETATNGDAHFERNTAHWRSTPQVEKIVVKKYATAAAVMTALTDGSLDAVMGAGVLAPADLKKIQTQHGADFNVWLGPPIMNRIIIINANKAPTDDLKLRKTIMAAVNKAAIIEKELSGFAEPADSLFPKNAPYCDIDLTPRWDYDIEKAKLLNCPALRAVSSSYVAQSTGVSVAIAFVASILLH